MKRSFWLAILFVCCCHLCAAELYVRPGDYPTIQSAIDDASDGDTVVVDPCTYYENINFLGKAITLTSLDPNDPCIVVATIINGSVPSNVNKGSVVTFSSGEGSDSVLTGFTITGGTGSWLRIYWQFKGYLWNRCGGGVLCYNSSSPTISKNAFTDNLAGQGGGIYFYNHSHPFIFENTFTENTVLVGHGFEDPDPCDPNIYDHGDGGAITGFQYCNANIIGNRIENNHASSYGGGIHLRQWCNGLIEDNNIIDNSALLGGGIHLTYTSSPTIRTNLIWDNNAPAFGGGGIYVYYLSNPIIERNTIRHNVSSRGAGIAVMWDSKPVISANLITDNFDGAGILCVGTSPDIIHNTITNNTTGLYSGGIHLEYGASPLIEHNIICSNRNGYGIYVWDGSTPSEPTIRFNDIWNHPMGNYHPDIGDQTGLNGNISAAPVFAGNGDEHYHLDVTSPCINAGDPNYPLSPSETDFEGDNRILGQYIDIGADEAWPVWNITNGTQYMSIQQSIDDANDGDTVIVSPSRYYEIISFGTHQIILSSSEPNDWNIVEQTIIDANQAGTVVSIAGGQDANTILRGFTITGGNATNGHAGGIWCYSAPTITRNIIKGNYASYKGGGIYFYGSSAAALVKDNRIINNTATYAGGVFCDASSRPRLEDNFIGYNTATTTGGGVCCSRNTGTVDSLGNTIVSNRAVWGGGMYIELASVNVVNNLFLGNIAALKGGAFEIVSSNPEVGDPNVVNNTIVHNKAPSGSGIYCKGFMRPLIANNIIAFGTQGQGIYGYEDPCRPVNAIIINNDVFGNVDGNYGGSIEDQTGLNGNISIDPNIVDPGYWDPNGTPSDANDDFFVAGNYHLLPISGCVNAGDNNSVPTSIDVDIDNEERFFDDIVDMGADEVVTNPFDLNTDGLVDLHELRVLSEEWLTSGPGLQTDFYHNDYVDFVDFAFLAQQWLWKGAWHE
jgi:parallel beta-helix repeat protein